MNFKNLKVSEILSETQFYTVVKIQGDKVQIKNDAGTNIVVDKNYVESCLTSATQYDKEETLNMTEAAAKFIAHTGVAITVNFNTKVKEPDVVKEIMEAYSSSTPKEIEAKVKKAVKNAMTGTERTMSGRHYGNMNELGRIQFTDMEVVADKSKSYDARLRLVDPRTINWFISRGIKYTIK